MKLESQVCSLESAKRLKELGVKQNGIFAHVNFAVGRSVFQQAVVLKSYLEDIKTPFEIIADAFTCSELGLIIKEQLDDSEIQDLFFMSAKPTLIREGIDEFVADTEADCRAKLIIHLIEREREHRS